MRAHLFTSLLPAVAASFVVMSPVAALAQAAPATAAPAGQPEDPDQRIKCRSMEVTGSIARRERVCKTVGEWRRIVDAGNANAREIIDYSRSRPSGQ